MKACYCLADKAYDTAEIIENIIASQMVPLIPKNKRKNEIQEELGPAQKERFKERSTAERFNSRLKDQFGGREIWFKGSKKVMCHLMFGVLTITADSCP